MNSYYGQESSMVVWYEVAARVLPTPKTIIYELSENARAEISGGGVVSDNIIKMLYKCGAEIGYPLFMRTDYISGKHNWVNTCFVKTEGDLLNHVFALVDESEGASLFGLPINALVFREFLDLESPFKAFNDMPVAKERRYFIRDGVVICHHPYWPEDAIRFKRAVVPPTDWKQKLCELNVESSNEIIELTKLAEKWPLPGYWSVDFAQDVYGKWWFIDAARGEVSYHPLDCPYNLGDVRVIW